MATKSVSMLERSDLEYMRSENAAFRGLNSTRNEHNQDRNSPQQLLQHNFKSYHSEDSRELNEAHKLVDYLEQENAKLRREIKDTRVRGVNQNGSKFGAQILNELESLNRRFEELQADLKSNLLMRNVQGKQGISQHEVNSLAENFRRMNMEIDNFRNLLSVSKAPNRMLVSSIRQGSKTVGIPSNVHDSNITSAVDDLVHIKEPPTENTICQELYLRMDAGKCLTRMGSVLVSVNSYDPYAQAGALSNSSDIQLVQTVVSQVIQRLTDTGPPQVFVLSGSSGSGKSFLSQVFLRQILEQGDGALDTEISKHFLASYCVMQSLSCGKTVNNSNSSRVGQLLEFYFSEGTISKTKMQCFPLGATRIVNPFPGERNFHIFYQLLSGITQEERAKLHLQGYSVHNLHYLNQSPLPNEDEEVIFRAKFERWRTGLATLGIPFTDVLRILVAILLLGNVQFVEGEGMDLDVKGNNEIKAIAALLGVSGVSLYRGLTTKTKNLRGQVFRSLCDPATANQNRDSLAMALYLRTLAAIVRRINSYKRSAASSSLLLNGSPQGSSESVRSGTPSPSTPDAATKAAYTNGILTTPPQGQPAWATPNGAHGQSDGASGLVAIMDMFGFEMSEVNRLEQICVNLCSETIQHFYNTHIFKSTEEHCREEGVLDEDEIDYVDIAACIELLTCQRAGILTLLDKESLFARGTPQGFLQKVRSHHADSECFYDPDPNGSLFAVCHYAGNVMYDSRTLLDTNRDSIPDDIVCVFSRQNCNFGFATHLFTSDLKTQQGQTASPKGALYRISPTQGPEPSRQGTSELDSGRECKFLRVSLDLPPSTFSQDFQGKLDGLLKTLVPAQPVFIRCIKANNKEEPGTFDRVVVNHQLRVLQVFETLQLLQSGFAHHSRFQIFIQKYGCPCPSGNLDLVEAGLDHCRVMLESQLEAADRTTAESLLGSWTLGKKYVFYSETMKQHLDSARDKRMQAAVTTLQAHVRRWISEKQWPGLRRSLEMQRKARSGHLRTNIKSSRPPLVPTDRELRVDTKTAEQTCCLYGLEMDTPPPVPKSRLYTVKGNVKMGFPQTRIMKQDLPGNDGELLLRKGEAVKVVSASRKRGFLIVEHENGSTIQVPYQLMELKPSPNPSPR